ncbi:MAG: DUF3472 domain-containing protein [Planctomycetaceae bacterium]
MYHDPGTKIENFGGEGTGLKSWNFELGWERGVWYTLVTRCWTESEHTLYGFWVRSDRTGAWTHLVTMDVAAKDAFLIGGNDSFIEDWLETGKNSRTTHLRRGWKRKLSGEWHAFQSARYSVNSWDLTEGKRSFNYRMNWNAGVARDETGPYYFMSAGGADTVATVANPSKLAIERDESAPDYAVISIVSANARTNVAGAVRLTWEVDPKSTPQFRYAVQAFDNAEGTGAPLAEAQRIEPHGRTADLVLPQGADPQKLHYVVRCDDILGRASEPLVVRLSE